MESLIKDIQSVISNCEQDFDAESIRQFQESIDSFSSLVTIGNVHSRGYNILSIDEFHIHNSFNVAHNDKDEELNKFFCY